MQRFGSLIKVKPEKLEEYKALHAAAWPGVLKRIADSNIRNYSIYLHNGLLFGYYEYIGTNYDADMAAIAADPITKEWWALTDPCQEPVESAKPGEWWAAMEEVFHAD